jgi:DNA-binding transcriptional LysR family regulator
MKKVCPTISELQAFDATAKHLSFTKAGLELFITQGAVSRQIANLEAYLGVDLFVRKNNELTLTEDGHFYLERVRDALDSLIEATQHVALRRGQKQYVNIAVPPTLTTHFLLPLMVDFYAKHPSITLNFVPYKHSHDFVEDNDLDMAIQFGEGEWPGTTSVYLIGKETAVICTARYAQEFHLDAPSAYADATLLQHTNVPHAWVHWFQDHKLPYGNAHLGPKFDQYSLIIEAAKLEFGVGLVPRCLVQRSLHKGDLSEPFSSRHLARQGYFLCIKKAKTNIEAVRIFTKWLAGLELSSADAKPPPARKKPTIPDTGTNGTHLS